MEDEEAVPLPDLPRVHSSTEKKKNTNVFLLGVSFMLIFTAFQTTGMSVKNVIDSVSKETNGTYDGNAYYSSSIIYAVFSVSNWIAPSVVAAIGLKLSLFAGAITYW